MPVTALIDPAGLGGVTITYTSIDGTSYPVATEAPANPGSYAVVATLNHPNYAAPDAMGSLTIQAAVSVVTLTSSLDPSAFGEAVTFTATLGASGATGTVQFKIDGTNLGAPVAVTNGAATSPSTATLTAGSHTVTAVYSGNAFYAGRDGPVHAARRAAAESAWRRQAQRSDPFRIQRQAGAGRHERAGLQRAPRFQDKGETGSANDLKFKSTAISSQYVTDNPHATFRGAGTWNGMAGYSFIVKVEDNAHKGAGYDKFRIRIFDGSGGLAYDTRTTVATDLLTSGKVHIHYDKDDFSTAALEGAGSFVNGTLNFDIDVRSDGAGGFNAGAGVQVTDPAATSFVLTSASITTMKVGCTITVTGPATYNGASGYKLQVDFETGKRTLHLHIWDATGKQIYDSKPSTPTSGTCTYIAGN